MISHEPGRSDQARPLTSPDFAGRAGVLGHSPSPSCFITRDTEQGARKTIASDVLLLAQIDHRYNIIRCGIRKALFKERG